MAGLIDVGSDMVFVLDASGSIGSGNFQNIKRFVKDVVNAFDIGPNKTQVGVVVYSSSVSRPFDLNTYASKAEVLAAVDRIGYDSGSTRTDLGLEVLTDVSFTPVRGARPTNQVLARI